MTETLLDLIKGKTRPMNPREQDLAVSVFGPRLPIQCIAIDPGSIPAKRKKTTAYVSFHTINFFKTIPDYILVHELVHIWQYKRYGSAYISESIWAQKWGGGYNYGGMELLVGYSERKGLAAFNFEQQADIIEDYYRWKNNMPMQWSARTPGIGAVLEKYRDNLV